MSSPQRPPVVGALTLPNLYSAGASINSDITDYATSGNFEHVDFALEALDMEEGNARKKRARPDRLEGVGAHLLLPLQQIFLIKL